MNESFIAAAINAITAIFAATVAPLVRLPFVQRKPKVTAAAIMNSKGELMFRVNFKNRSQFDVEFTDVIAGATMVQGGSNFAFEDYWVEVSRNNENQNKRPFTVKPGNNKVIEIPAAELRLRWSWLADLEDLLFERHLRYFITVNHSLSTKAVVIELPLDGHRWHPTQKRFIHPGRSAD